MNHFNLEILNVNQYILNHKKEFDMEIGESIKNIRIKKNISIEEIATRTFMLPNYINKLEKGKYGISLNKFIIICNALEINTQEFLDNYLYSSKINEDILYNELQKEKNISINILNFMKNKQLICN